MPNRSIAGAHWVVPPAEGAPIALGYQGPVAPEAEAAFAELRAEEPKAGLLAITSPDRLHAGWLAALRARREGERDAQSHVERVAGAACPRRRRWLRCWTGIRRRMPGWERSGASASFRSVRIASGRAAISGIFTASIGLIRTLFWTPAPGRCCNESEFERKKRSAGFGVGGHAGAMACGVRHADLLLLTLVLAGIIPPRSGRLAMTVWRSA